MTVELKVPEAGESISEVEVAEWLKSAGERVNRDDVVAIIETEKASLEVTAPASGVIKEVLKGAGESAKPGEVIGYIEEGQPAEKEEEAPKKAPPEKTEEKAGETGEEEAGAKAAEKSKPKEAGDGAQPQKPRVKLEGKKSVEKREEKRVSDAAPSGEEGAGRGEREVEAKEEERRAEPSAPEKPEKKAPEPADGRGREEEVVPMSLLRRQIAERLVQAQGNAALLTTFNEIDMSAVIDLRRTHREAFMEHHGVKLGFMSFFVKATVEALKRVPALNAEIRERNIVYRNYFDIGIAIGSGKGLVVPVLRDADRMSFAEIERTIDDFAKRAQKNALKMEELRGGTFSITNGGIYGSLLSTPIVNPPQSGILGLHAIQERPVARNGEVVVRSMMYVALTYDHRIVDGREAVTALRSIKEMLEQPARILLEI